MTPVARLNLWTVLVVTLVVTQHAWLALSPLPAVPHAAFGTAAYLLLLGLFALLVTTPADAIRLATRTSVVVLAVITGAIYGHAWLRSSGTAWDGAAVVAVVAAVTVAAGAAPRRGVSPWAAVVPVWVPLFTGPNAMPAWPAAGFVVAWLVAFRIATPRRD